MESRFDFKIIPEFDGTGDMVEWLEKLELVCDPASYRGKVLPRGEEKKWNTPNSVD